MITINELISLCADLDNIIISQHAFVRLRERGITTDGVIDGIRSGEIIEQYPDDYPYPSFLVLGWLVNNKPIHIVCGVGDGKLWIITAYIPGTDKWDDDYKTRKAVSI